MTARRPPSSPNPADLAARIRAVLPGLSPAETRVAQLVEADPAGVAALTVTELADRAATSAATVVRAARSLGFAGYPQLRLALAAHGGSLGRADGVPLGADIAETDTVAVVLAKLAAFESEQIRTTAELVDPVALDLVIAAIRSARRVDIYGIGASGLVAEELTRTLCRIGLSCRALTERDAALVSACLLMPGDLAIGVSHSGENVGTVRPLALARQAGAATVAITGSTRSALARQAEHVLVTAGRELGFQSAAVASRTGSRLVAAALFIGVARSLPGALGALERTDEVLAPPGRRTAPRTIVPA
ncbi:MAG: MurR/RpiR family transcriptional regulator [Cellulomonas sp.]